MQVSQTNRHRHLKQQILPVARKAFSLHGIKAVKMDDIASTMKISKRTLYETYLQGVGDEDGALCQADG